MAIPQHLWLPFRRVGLCFDRSTEREQDMQSMEDPVQASWAQSRRAISPWVPVSRGSGKVNAGRRDQGRKLRDEVLRFEDHKTNA